MRKMFLTLSLVVSLGAAVGAACFGPFCFDDTGASVAGTLFDGNGDGTPIMTVAQEQAACPKAKGQEIYCSDCKANGNTGTICISTSTTCNATTNFDYVLSTGTKCL